MLRAPARAFPLFLLLVAASPPVWAAEPPLAPLSIRVDGAAPGLDPEALRVAIADELKTTVWRAGERAEGRELSVRFDAPAHAIVVYHDGKGHEVARAIALPERPESTIETVALLAGNLVRDEASELLADDPTRASPREVPTVAAPATPPAATTNDDGRWPRYEVSFLAGAGGPVAASNVEKGGALNIRVAGEVTRRFGHFGIGGLVAYETTGGQSANTTSVVQFFGDSDRTTSGNWSAYSSVTSYTLAPTAAYRLDLLRFLYVDFDTSVGVQYNTVRYRADVSYYAITNHDTPPTYTNTRRNVTPYGSGAVTIALAPHRRVHFLLPRFLGEAAYQPGSLGDLPSGVRSNFFTPRYYANLEVTIGMRIGFD